VSMSTMVLLALRMRTSLYSTPVIVPPSPQLKRDELRAISFPQLERDVLRTTSARLFVLNITLPSDMYFWIVFASSCYSSPCSYIPSRITLG
jgi:hypothetical protein